MLRKRIGALLLAGGLAAAISQAAWSADPLSPATKRLFDAVWADDMGQVKASVVDGADLAAIDESGVRAVDLAVDKGHYDIAHYLLSVEKLRGDSERAVQPVAAPVPAPVAAPVPAPVPIVDVAPAPIVQTGVNPVQQAAPVGVAARQPVKDPVPQPEALWKPSSTGQQSVSPKVKIIGRATPQPVVETEEAPVLRTSEKTSGADSLRDAVSGDENSGFLERVTDFFDFSKDPTKTPVRPSQSPAPVQVPSEKTKSPAPQSLAPIENDVAAASAPKPVPESISEPEPKQVEAPKPLQIEPAPVARSEETAAIDESPSFLQRISNALQPDQPEPEPHPERLQAPVEPEQSIAAEPEVVPKPESASASVEAAQVTEKPESNLNEPSGPSPAGQFFDRVADFFSASNDSDNVDSAEAQGSPVQSAAELEATDADPSSNVSSEPTKPPEPPISNVETASAHEPIPKPVPEPVPEPVPVAETDATETSGPGFLDSLTKWLQRDEPVAPVEGADQRAEEPVIEIRPPAKPSIDPPPQAQPQPVAEPVLNPSRQAEPGVVRVVQAPRPARQVASVPVKEKVQKPPLTPVEPQAAVVDKISSVSSVSAKPRRVASATAGPPVRNPAKVAEPLIATAGLKDASFEFGSGIRLGMSPPDQTASANTCVDKARWDTRFCIEPMTWPEAVGKSFHAESSIYRGEQAIVQYVGERSVQVHVLFPAKALWTVTEHFKRLYGPPTEMPEIWTAMIGEPKRPNRVLRWHNRDSRTGDETLLEIREIDDLRWSSPPDTKHGVVRVLEKGRGSVFQLLSSTDLLLVGLRGRRQ